MIQVERRMVDRRQDTMATMNTKMFDQSCPASASAENVLVILTSGVEDKGKRATLAFSVACSALAVDKKVSIFLVGDGSYFADEENCDQVMTPGFPPLAALVENFLQLGGELSVCSACASEGAICGIDEAKKMAALKLRQGVTVRGFASLIDDAAQSTILTF